MTTDVAALRAHFVDPYGLCDALGLVDGRASYRRQARGLTIRCPWHDERTPSCSVTLGPDGTVRAACFGCQRTGDAFHLIAAAHGLDVRRDFARVLELAAQLAGVSLDAPTLAPPARVLPPEPPRLDDDTFDAIAGVIARRCPVDGEADARAYLLARGLYDAAAPALAALPASPAAQARLVDAIVAEVGADAWARSGLASERGGFVFAEHRLVAFWRAPGTDGPVQTIQRRIVRAAQPGDRVGKYVFATRRPPRWPYGLEHADALGPAGEVAFVEGFLDALALRALCAHEGIDRLVLGLPGTAGWARDWAALAAGRVAVVATDPDAAGEAAAVQMSEDLWDAGALDVRRATPDGAPDWSELLARSCAEVAA